MYDTIHKPLDVISFMTGTHQFKFGVDCRRIATLNSPRAYDLFAYFSGAGPIGGHTSVTTIDAQEDITVYFDNHSAFAQDTWKMTPRLTLTYGLRWEFNPAPHGSKPLDTFTDDTDPHTIAPAPAGTPLYRSMWKNFAPRIGAAYLRHRFSAIAEELRGSIRAAYSAGESNQPPSTAQSANGLHSHPNVVKAREPLIPSRFIERVFCRRVLGARESLPGTSASR